MRVRWQQGRIFLGLFFGLTAVASGEARAAADAVVEAVQAPAWVQRGERRLPLAPGMVLENRDRLLTGPDGRLILQLADGAAVKLGEGAEVSVNALQQRRDGVFSAALDVARGAFRYTSGVFVPYQSRRAINVRAGSVTIGIRGTDVWGRSEAARDFVCLLEGRVVATHTLAGPVELSEPLQFFGADRGQAPGPVSLADRVQVFKWAIETEPGDRAGVRRQDGRWRLEFVPRDEAAALALYDRLGAAGVASRIVPVGGRGSGYRYGLRIDRLDAEAEADALADRLAVGVAGERPAVVGRR